MAYDIFHSYGLNKIHDSFTENYDYKDSKTDWELVKGKYVKDSDGFLTEYTWYTDGTKHIFMFGDSDIYTPDEDYADHIAESDSEAEEWFDSYNGFEEEEDPWEDFEEDDVFKDAPSGNANFMNDGFESVYGNGEDLEE